MESASYVFSFRVVIFYLVTTGWIFDISAYVRIQSTNQSIIIFVVVVDSKTFVLFRFRLYAFIEAAALRSIVPRYAGAVTATRVSSFFPFVSLEMMPFPSTFCTIAISSSYGECVIRFFLPGGDFLPCDHGLDF